MPSIGSGFSAGTAWIDVKPDLSNFGRQMSADVKRSTSGFSNVGKAIGKTLAIGIGAGLVGVGVFIKGALEEAQEALQLEAQTAAVLKSTRLAANITSKEIDKLTGSIQGYAAISDEVVREGVNMLLTFKNIRNEAGKNNDIFTQTTEILADVSVAMGRDMPSTAIMLGKALNDPIKGISAMTRVGIQFTEQQTEQITKMVEANDVMGAQKVILKELESQFGGSARAVGNTKPWEKLMLIFGEIQEGIGKALIPSLNSLAKRLTKFVQSKEFQQWLVDVEKWMTENIPKGIEKLEGLFGDLAEFWRRDGEAIKNVIGGIKTAFSIMNKLNIFEIRRLVKVWAVAFGALKATWNAIKNAFTSVWNTILRIFGNIASTFVGAYRKLMDTFLGGIQTVLDAVAKVPGPWRDAAESMAKTFGNFRESVNASIGSVERNLDSLGETTKSNMDKSRRSIAGVNTEIGKLITNLKGVSAPGTIRAEFVGGDGPGIMGMMGGLAASWARQAIAAVPGPQGISNTYRSPAHNAMVGGAPGSYHTDASNPAADITGTNLMGIFNWLVRNVGGSAREIIYTPAGYSIQHGARGPNIGDHYDHVHVADRGGWFKGPGFVHMGRGYEMFAGGLQPARKMSDGSVPHVVVEIHPKRGMEGIERFIDVRVRDGIEDNQRYLESRQRVSR